jgi:hypothetical protein
MMRNCITLKASGYRRTHHPDGRADPRGSRQSGSIRGHRIGLDDANAAVRTRTRPRTFRMTVISRGDRADRAPRSVDFGGLSTWLNHSARLAARRRPRLVERQLQLAQQAVTSRAVTWPMLGRVPSVARQCLERSEAAREEFAVTTRSATHRSNGSLAATTDPSRLSATSCLLREPIIDNRLRTTISR